MTTVDYESQIRSIKAELDQAHAAQARVRVQSEAATEALKAARASLLDLYGVATTEQAQGKLTELEAALATAISETKAKLAQA